MRIIAPFRLTCVPRPKHAVHRVGEALYALVEFGSFVVFTQPNRTVPGGPAFVVVTFVAITLISDRTHGVGRQAA